MCSVMHLLTMWLLLKQKNNNVRTCDSPYAYLYHRASCERDKSAPRLHLPWCALCLLHVVCHNCPYSGSLIFIYYSKCVLISFITWPRALLNRKINSSFTFGQRIGELRLGPTIFLVLMIFAGRSWKTKVISLFCTRPIGSNHTDAMPSRHPYPFVCLIHSLFGCICFVLVFFLHFSGSAAAAFV